MGGGQGGRLGYRRLRKAWAVADSILMAMRLPKVAPQSTDALWHRECAYVPGPRQCCVNEGAETLDWRGFPSIDPWESPLILAVGSLTFSSTQMLSLPRNRQSMASARYSVNCACDRFCRRNPDNQGF
jgi:hypothetical protein